VILAPRVPKEVPKKGLKYVASFLPAREIKDFMGGTSASDETWNVPALAWILLQNGRGVNLQERAVACDREPPRGTRRTPSFFFATFPALLRALLHDPAHIHLRIARGHVKQAGELRPS
jgi:hypothetical protein